jgi:hypothetical protein
MTTKYEVMCGPEWRYVSSWDSIDEAFREADRIGAKFNVQTFVQKNINGVIYR